jgi:hypothetical protein
MFGWRTLPKNGTHRLCYILDSVVVAKVAFAYSTWPYIKGTQRSGQV